MFMIQAYFCVLVSTKICKDKSSRYLLDFLMGEDKMKTIKEELKLIKRRNEVIRTLQDLAESKGFLKVESDAFEEYLSYLEQNPRQNPKELVKVSDLRGNIYFLKPDTTTNLIKQLIPRIQKEDFFELYYIEKVYQFNKNGKISSTRQFGIELIGKNGSELDIRLIGLIKEILSQFNVNYVIELGNQEWLNIILSELDLTRNEAEKLKKSMISKDKEAITKLLSKKTGEGYLQLLNHTISNQNNLEYYQEIITKYKLNPKLTKVINKMKQLQSSITDTKIEIDLSLINEFDYYNGPIFKVYINNYKEDILRGGRYDYLTKEFGKLTPALGFSLDVDVLIKEVL